MYQENDESIEITLSVSEVIQYESSSGEIMQGEVMEIAETIGMVKVLPIGELLRIPEWVKANDILLDEEVEYT